MYYALFCLVAATSAMAAPQPCHNRAYIVEQRESTDQFLFVTVQLSGEFILHVRRHPALLDGYYSGCLTPNDAAVLSCLVSDLSVLLPRPSGSYCPQLPSFHVSTVDGVNTTDRSYSCCLSDLPESPLGVVRETLYAALCHSISPAFATRHPVLDHAKSEAIQAPPCLR